MVPRTITHGKLITNTNRDGDSSGASGAYIAPTEKELAATINDKSVKLEAITIEGCLLVLKPAL